MELRNSSVWNDGVQVFRSLAGATVAGSCVLAHESASFGPATIANPLYVDTTGDEPDYSLQLGSPAIDRCAASGTNEADVRDIARPQDMPQANLAGPFDAGAYDFAPDDVIFADGFELSIRPQPVAGRDDRRRAMAAAEAAGRDGLWCHRCWPIVAGPGVPAGAG